MVHLAVPATRSLRTGKVVVLLPTTDGGTSELDAEQLASLLVTDDLRLLVLDLSPATEFTTLDVLSEFGPVLLRGGVRAVLGLVDGVASGDRPAALEQVYGSLAAGQPISGRERPMGSWCSCAPRGKPARSADRPRIDRRCALSNEPGNSMPTLWSTARSPTTAAARLRRHGSIWHRLGCGTPKR